MIGVRSGINEYGQSAEEVISGYVGEFKYFGFANVPPHCLACDGSEISRTTYSELFEVFGETFGAGDGVTTFNLPDLRGAFLRCIGGNAAELGELQEGAIQNITGELQCLPLGSSRVTDTSVLLSAWNGALRTISGGGSSTAGRSITLESLSRQTDLTTFDASRVVNTANEVRPVNVAVNICVVYE